MKYLKKINDTCWVLDHHLTPEVSAMFAAMSSRLSAGGIEQRYLEVVRAVAGIPSDVLNPDKSFSMEFAEEALTTYPLHPKVQEFFDKFVGQYGHASIMECVGSPPVYVQGVSPFTAYLSFDNPLVMGQEFSTRAVRHKNWPLCREAYVSMAEYAELVGPTFCDDPQYIVDHGTSAGMPHPELKALHEAWLEVFEAEVEAWKAELRKPCTICDGAKIIPLTASEDQTCGGCRGTGKKYPWIKDPQSFRPALDRARWAIPSTISTGFCHTANTRVMGRVIADGMAFGTRPITCSACGGNTAGRLDDTSVSDEPARMMCMTCRGKGDIDKQSQVWQNIKEAYEEALPGMKGMWMREAVIGEERQLPGHLKIGFVEPDDEVTCTVLKPFYSKPPPGSYVRKARGYLDPSWNQTIRVFVEFQCSWAVARDWHRHRTAYPWHMNIVDTDSGEFSLHNDYSRISEFAAEIVGEGGNATARWVNLMDRSRDLFDKFRKAGDMEKAMLCLPFGTLVSMRTTMGLRDAVYMLELRANAHGANFEYEAQAKEALTQLKGQLGDLVPVIFPEE